MLDLQKGAVFWPPNEHDSLECARVVFEDPELTSEDERYQEFSGEYETLFDYNAENFDSALAEVAIRHNRDVLDRLTRALGAKSFQVPEMKGFGDSFAPLTDFNNLASLEGCQMRWKLEQDRPDRAYDAALRVVRLGRRLQAADGVLLVWLVGGAVEQLGLDQLGWLLGRTSPPAAQRKEIDALTRDDGAILTQSLQQTLRAEFWLGRNAVTGSPDQDIEELVPFGGLLLLRNQTVRWLAEEARISIANAALPPGERKVSDIETKYGLRSWGSMVKNYPGRVIMGLLLTMQMSTKKDEILSKRRGTRLLIAMRSYFDATGKLPESLQELTGEYIEQQPLDPWTGEPFLYDRNTRRIYCVGPDGVDDGGQDADAYDNDDPTIEILFGQAASDSDTE